MSIATGGMAEVYAMKRLHKEKIKRMQGVRIQEVAEHNHTAEKTISGGCFSLRMFKKIHPTSLPLSRSPN